MRRRTRSPNERRTTTRKGPSSLPSSTTSTIATTTSPTAVRYSQSLLKPHHHRQISVVQSDFDYNDGPDPPNSAASDAKSSLSFQPLPRPKDLHSDATAGVFDVIMVELVVAAVERDLVVAESAELVVAVVERDLVAVESAEAQRRWSELARKIELQGSLLEVLESERMVLLGENARLGFRAMVAKEEGRAVAAKLEYMWWKAGELAQLVVKLREDHRVCLLGKKIEGLQVQIYRLERRNRDCFEAMAKEKREWRKWSRFRQDHGRRCVPDVGAPAEEGGGTGEDETREGRAHLGF